MHLAHPRPAWRAAVVLSLATFVSPVATGAQSGSANEVQSFLPQPAPRVDLPPSDPPAWSDFTSDVLGSRLTSTVE